MKGDELSSHGKAQEKFKSVLLNNWYGKSVYLLYDFNDMTFCKGQYYEDS